MKIGVLGGTFDPIHNGHLVIAEVVRTRLDMTQVLFIPTGHSWLKTGRRITPAVHRTQMVRLGIAGEPFFQLSLVEVERPGPSFTVDTITELNTRLGPGVQLFFILGWDNLTDLPRWKEPQRLVKLCRLVAVPRPGSSIPDVGHLEKVIPGLSKSVILLDEPHIDISATEIRRRTAQGLSICDLVPETVGKYIKEHGLYMSKAPLASLEKKDQP